MLQHTFTPQLVAILQLTGTLIMQPKTGAVMLHTTSFKFIRQHGFSGNATPIFTIIRQTAQDLWQCYNSFLLLNLRTAQDWWQCYNPLLLPKTAQTGGNANSTLAF